MLVYIECDIREEDLARITKSLQLGEDTLEECSSIVCINNL